MPGQPLLTIGGWQPRQHSQAGQGLLARVGPGHEAHEGRPPDASLQSCFPSFVRLGIHHPGPIRPNQHAPCAGQAMGKEVVRHAVLPFRPSREHRENKVMLL